MDNYTERVIIEVLMEQLGLQINDRVDNNDTQTFIQQINSYRKGAASNAKLNASMFDKSLLN